MDYRAGDTVKGLVKAVGDTAVGREVSLSAGLRGRIDHVDDDGVHVVIPCGYDDDGPCFIMEVYSGLNITASIVKLSA